MSQFQILPWSEGEKKMHALLRVPEDTNPTSLFLTPQAANLSTYAPLIAIGTLDDEGRLWTSLWGGSRGSARPLGGNHLGMRCDVDGEYDPVASALARSGFEKGRMISALPIDLESRKRVKLFGRVVAGKMDVDDDGVGDVQLVFSVEQSLGNCPKYLNQRDISHAMPTSTLVSDSAKLPEEAIALLERADLFFMTTINGDTDMDCNHRGGPPGFIRLLSNDPAVLVYPEYSGNRLYSSLGNLMQDPRIGIVVPDFDTGDALYLTGTAAILIGGDAAAVMPRSQLAVRITAASARFVRRTLALRGAPGEPSPYNPAVRLLAREGALLAQQHAAGAPSGGEATVLKVAARVDLTPTIARYELRRVAGPPLRWRPGQWVALDFSAELDRGYSHMRDDDPQSINDDFTRTFTISSYPRGGTDDAVELTLRTNGPVTNMLRRRRLDGTASSLEIAVRGVGGQFELPKKDDVVFLAGGVGITPLLGQLAGMDVERVKVGWVIKSEDVSFVLDVLRKYPGITNGMAIFLTGHRGAANQDMMEEVSRMGAKVWNRRITRDDLTNFEISSKWYLCAGKGLRTQLLEWWPEEEVVFENFDY